MRKYLVMLAVFGLGFMFLTSCVFNTEGVNIKKTTIDSSGVKTDGVDVKKTTVDTKSE